MYMRCSMSNRRNAEVSHTCHKQTSTTTNGDDTACSSSSTPMWTQITVVDGHKFSAVRHLSCRLFERLKNTILPTPTCIRRLRWGGPMGIFHDLKFSHFGTILTCDKQKDEQTDRHRATANTELAPRRMGKMTLLLKISRYRLRCISIRQIQICHFFSLAVSPECLSAI